jgi:DNA-binding response OmpR family regulator
LLERGLPIDPDFFARPIKRILVVDDEAAMLEIIVRTLHQIPHIELATASDGFEAGLQVATFKPDLLVLDLMMPHADGFEVCRFIRRNPATAHIKILVITAFGSHENIQRALDAGANDFMHKPLQLEQLSAKVRALLTEE